MPPKRKRGGASDVGGIRPSPHRPEQTTLGQHDRDRRDGRDSPDSMRGGRFGYRQRDRFHKGPPSQDDARHSPAPNAATNGASPAVIPAVVPAQPTPPAQQRPQQTPQPQPQQQQPQPPAQTMAKTEPQAKAPAFFAALPRLYVILTDARIENWTTGTGRQEVVDSAVQARDDEDEIDLSTLFQELLYSVVDGRLDPADAGGVVKEVVTTDQDIQDNGAAMSSQELTLVSGTAFDARIVFLDTVSVFVEMADAAAVDPYVPALRGFMANSGVSPALMRQVLDNELLMRLGMLRETFHRMSIRYSTNLLYRQQSYNLLREETEGFSKLVTELYTSSSGATQDPAFDVACATFEKVKGLIGTFDLDVGRVLDISLDVFAATIIKQFKFFVKFLRISSWWPRGHPHNSFFSGLPRWAQPDLAHENGGIAGSSEDEEDGLVAEERRKRDIAFWETARQVHLHAFFQLGGREIAHPQLQRLANRVNGTDGNDPDAMDDANSAKEIDSEAFSHYTEQELEWIKATKTMPPPGNRVAAQIFGFKLRFYSSDARTPDDILPANLLYLAALLVKIGFISFCDLYPHLWPPDEGMDALRKKREEELEKKERESRPGFASNALAMAGALSDDMPQLSGPGNGTALRWDAPGAASSAAGGTGAGPNGSGDGAALPESDGPKLPEPADMKIQILDHLLLIGAIPEALFVIGRFPWIMELYAENLLPLIHRILLHSVQKVADAARAVPILDAAVISPPPAKKMPESDKSSVVNGNIVKRTELYIRRPFRWPFADKPDVADGQPYRYYFDEWVDNVPVCQSVDDVFTLCESFLGVSGVCIGQEPELLISLATIGCKSLHDDPSPSNRQRWYDLLKRLLVPALSLVTANTACVDAVWQVLRTYPLRQRYELYAEWYEGPTSRQPAISKAFERTRRETMGTMRRISKDNKAVMGRSLAKTALSSPGVVFKVALGQLEAYDNIIDVFVSCARYFTELGYDVLVWSLMRSLGGKQRSRTQETSVLLTSKWLQALSKFSGQVFTSFPNMDVTPVVQYVNNQLAGGNSTDLIILKELILSMGGLVSDADFTDAQIQAMTGGPALRRLTLTSLGDKRVQSHVSAQRLMKALVHTRLAGRLLINLVQYRQSVIYTEVEKEAHIKYLASKVDDTHQILTQYLDLLRSNLTPAEFDSLVPGVPRLMKDCGLDTALAFMVGRAGLDFHAAMAQLPPPATTTTAAAVAAEEDKENMKQEMEVDADTNADADADADADAPMKNGDAPAAEALASPPPQAQQQSLGPLQPLVESIAALLPDRLLKRISPEFYVTFWTLQLGDINVPRARYEAEIERMSKESAAIKNSRPTDASRAAMMRRNEEAETRLNDRRAMAEEMLSLITRNRDTKQHLTRQAKTWMRALPGGKPYAAAGLNNVSDLLIEQCLIPRMLISAADTEYCFRMVRFLHDVRTPGFQLMALYNRLFSSNRLRDLIFTCTVREAEHVGRFLRFVLGDLARWHGDKAAYEREGLGAPAKSGEGSGERTLLGFAKAFSEDDAQKPTAWVEHLEFRDLLYTWHKNLNTALKDCLENLEWMHIRNAITVLKSVIDYFPAVDFMGKQFAEQLGHIAAREGATKAGAGAESETEHRVDLSVTAQTIYSELLRRQPKWVLVQAFRRNAKSKPTAEEAKAAAESSKASSSTALRPDASEFKPLKGGRNDVSMEDGELNDAIVAAGRGGPVPTGPAGMMVRGASRPSPALGGKPTSNNRGDAQAAKQAAGITSLPHPHSLPNRPDVPMPGSRYQQDRIGQLRNQERRDASPGRSDNSGGGGGGRSASNSVSSTGNPSTPPAGNGQPANTNHNSNASGRGDARGNRDVRDARDHTREIRGPRGDAGRDGDRSSLRADQNNTSTRRGDIRNNDRPASHLQAGGPQHQQKVPPKSQSPAPPAAAPAVAPASFSEKKAESSETTANAGTNGGPSGRTQSPRTSERRGGGSSGADSAGTGPMAVDPMPTSDRGRDRDRESRDNREGREGREDREGRESRESRHAGEAKDGREGREGRESRDGRDGRDRARDRDEHHHGSSSRSGQSVPQATKEREPGTSRSSGGDRGERSDRAERGDKGSRSGRSERSDRAERSERTERSERSDRPPREPRESLRQGDADRGRTQAPPLPPGPSSHQQGKHQESSYGRLNAGPSGADGPPPSGPRNSRGHTPPDRYMASGQPIGSQRTGRRGGRGGPYEGTGSGLASNNNNNNNGPPPPSRMPIVAPSLATSVNMTPVGGLHGDRMRNFSGAQGGSDAPTPAPVSGPNKSGGGGGGGGPGSGPSSNTPTGPSSSMRGSHDRPAANTPQQQPQQQQQQPSAGDAGHSGPGMSAASDGPRQTPLSSTAPASGNGAREGAREGERTPRVRGNERERMMKGIQDMISGGGGGGLGSRRSSGYSSSRGQAMAGSDAQVLAGGSQPSTPMLERRPDPINSAAGPQGNRPSRQGDERDFHDSRGGVSSNGSRRGDGERPFGSGRQRRSSRERSPGPGGGGPGPSSGGPGSRNHREHRDHREHREHRDHRDRGDRGGDRRSDLSILGASGQNPHGPPPPPPPPLPMQHHHQPPYQHQGPHPHQQHQQQNLPPNQRRSMSNRDLFGGGGPGGMGGMGPARGDPNREPVGFGRESRRGGGGGGSGGGPGDGDHRGRKRRSDEGLGPLASDREKKLRR